jgi:pimeloyl-ACP methyl ester carboxylesterase
MRKTQADDVADYIYQSLMRDGAAENAPMINFNIYMSAHIPLGTSDKLASEKFQLPISFVYGDNDWVHDLEGDISETILKKNKFTSDKNGVLSSRIHFVPTSDHAMHMENPEGLANTLINDVYDLGLSIKPNPLNPMPVDENSSNKSNKSNNNNIQIVN